MTLRAAYEHIQAGRITEAEAALAAATDTDPFERLTVQAGLRMKLRDFAGALGILDEAARIRPADFTVHFNAGLCLYESGRFVEACEAYERSLYANAGYAKAWMKLGGAHLPRAEFAEALACHERAVGLDPLDAELRIALGTTISLLGDDAGAEAQFRRALELNPDAFEAKVALGFVLLRAGKWEEGWKRFEARWQIRPFGAAWDYQPRPFWTGRESELRDKTVLLLAEQGHGDTIQFLRYAPLVAKRAKSTTVAVPPSLVRLACSMGLRAVSNAEPLPEAEIVTSLMSLPGIFGTTTDRVPPPAAFKVSSVPCGAWLGLCWHGGAREYDPMANADDRRRSVSWEEFDRLACVVNCISLQQELLQPVDWLDTAERIKGLKLVITVDTAVAHLAASLGVETWLLARAGGCWRWLSKGDRTPWYPSMRIYRQETLCDWRPTIARVEADLKAWAAKHAGQ